MVITTIAVFFPMFVTSSLFGMNRSMYYIPPAPPCPDLCRVSLVESIPANLTYPPGSPSHVTTYQTWMNLINMANSSIRIASLYWTLRSTDTGPHPTDWQGEDVYNALLSAGSERGINIEIAQSCPTAAFPNQDTADLAEAGAAHVRSVNFTQYFGAGVLHTKLWIIDDTHVYVGSANMDWRSLTQVKEMGLVAYNCSCLAADMQKLFDVYWYLGQANVTIPKYWPKKYETKFNADRPFNVSLNGTSSNVYFSSSPAALCPHGRAVDIDTILRIIDEARRYIHIAVMDYFPITLYTKHTQFWPVIDDRLRRAALERRVRVRLLASWWNHSRPDIVRFMTSLAALNGANGADIQVKLFHVPVYPDQEKIPFARVNHNKYMVTESVAYIGTSNWSGDYFINTGGVGYIQNTTHTADTQDTGAHAQDIRDELEDVFDRDWNSTYAQPLLRTRHNKQLKTIDQYSRRENTVHEL